MVQEFVEAGEGTDGEEMGRVRALLTKIGQIQVLTPEENRFIRRCFGPSWKKGHIPLGISSKAMVMCGLGWRGEPEIGEYPYDTDDLRRCEDAYAKAPARLQFRMKAVLWRYRVAVEIRSMEWYERQVKNKKKAVGKKEVLVLKYGSEKKARRALGWRRWKRLMESCDYQPRKPDEIVRRLRSLRSA